MDKITGNVLMLSGIIIFSFGLIASFLPKGMYPKLPGDVLIQREGFTFYFPIVTSLVLSLFFSLLLWLFKR